MDEFPPCPSTSTIGIPTKEQHRHVFFSIHSKHKLAHDISARSRGHVHSVDATERNLRQVVAGAGFSVNIVAKLREDAVLLKVKSEKLSGLEA